MNVSVIVQARMTSSRLPGKVMLPLGSKTVLGEVLTRCWQINRINQVCCAIPIGAEHDILEEEIKKYKAILFRGSENNVLERYYEAAKFLKADIIMRITSDCPLINSEVCGKVLEKHIITCSEYTCNNMPPTWPHGYDCEVFGINQLKEAVINSYLPQDFEHVTTWMRRSLKVLNLENPNGNQYSDRITLDTIEDYKKISEIFNEISITNNE